MADTGRDELPQIDLFISHMVNSHLKYSYLHGTWSSKDYAIFLDLVDVNVTKFAFIMLY